MGGPGSAAVLLNRTKASSIRLPREWFRFSGTTSRPSSASTSCPSAASKRWGSIVMITAWHRLCLLEAGQIRAESGQVLIADLAFERRHARRRVLRLRILDVLCQPLRRVARVRADVRQIGGPAAALAAHPMASPAAVGIESGLARSQ